MFVDRGQVAGAQPAVLGEVVGPLASEVAARHPGACDLELADGLPVMGHPLTGLDADDAQVHQGDRLFLCTSDGAELLVVEAVVLAA